MRRRRSIKGLMIVLSFLLCGCAEHGGEANSFTGADEEVRLMTLDPGHFHAALVQKTRLDQVSPVVHVYAPNGPDVEDHLARIDGFNARDKDPTGWKQRVFLSDHYLAKMLRDRPGNVVVISGANRSKSGHIKACVDAGLNVLSDKPMCVDAASYTVLEAAFDAAEDNGVLLYDIMTERSEITTILQKRLSQDPKLFGRLMNGTVDDPAVVKESVHHFFKSVAGRPIKRPTWYFDTTQQGEGIVDVTTHLVDLAMWACFPQECIDFARDVRMKQARRWPTLITRKQFEKVTRAPGFPDYLVSKLDADGRLPCYANGEIVFTLKGVYVRVSVAWEFEAPAGGGDTHFSIMKGTNANLVIRQGKEQGYRPELYVEPAAGVDREALDAALNAAVAGLQDGFAGVTLEGYGDGWRVLIPDQYRIGHEAHFQQVMERYLQYLVDGKLPEWEVPNMKTKYRITTEALEMATGDRDG